MEPGILVAVACISVLAICFAGFALVRVITLPDTPRLHAAVAEMIGRVEEIASHNAETRRAFRTLESDVERHLEHASERLKRSKTAEAVARRQTNRQHETAIAAEEADRPGQPGPPVQTLEQQRSALESQMASEQWRG